MFDEFRYLVVVIGADGRMHRGYAYHHLEIALIESNLRKQALPPIQEVRRKDLSTGKPPTPEELYAE